MLAVGKRTTELLKCLRLDGSRQIGDTKYLFQGPQNLVVMNVRDNKSTGDEGVDYISSLFVNLDSVEIIWFSGNINSTEVSREFPDPPELNLEFSDD